MSPQTDLRLTIGELAEAAGMTVRNVRNHQSRGLIGPPVLEARTGYYGAEHLERLQLIRRMKPLGFSVQEMRELLDARDTVAADQTHAEARERLARFAEDVKRRADDLAAKASRGSQLVAVLERESRGEIVDGRAPEFGDS